MHCQSNENMHCQSNENKCLSKTQYPQYRGGQMSDLEDPLGGGYCPVTYIFRKLLSS